MTQLQQIEFELLQCFVAVCEQLNLTYYLVCGSALGAAKYRGFIPWDDDVDVALPREDYAVFLEKAPALLPEKFFLQNYKSDPAFPSIISKLRNSETTFIEKTVSHLPIHHGIYIDIFPLDGYPKGRLEQKWLEFRKKLYLIELNCAFEAKRKWKTEAFVRLLRLLGYHKRTAKTAAKYEKLISRYPIENSALVCNHGNWQGRLEYAPKHQYGAGCYGSFEGLRVRLPEQYDEYLSQKYGAWRDDLLSEEQVGHHFCTHCDTTRSYLEFL